VCAFQLVEIIGSSSESENAEIQLKRPHVKRPATKLPIKKGQTQSEKKETGSQRHGGIIKNEAVIPKPSPSDELSFSLLSELAG
jgi:hypothetical protein